MREGDNRINAKTSPSYSSFLYCSNGIIFPPFFYTTIRQFFLLNNLNLQQLRVLSPPLNESNTLFISFHERTIEAILRRHLKYIFYKKIWWLRPENSPQKNRLSDNQLYRLEEEERESVFVLSCIEKRETSLKRPQLSAERGIID